MKEYEILSDTGTCRKLVAKINRMAKEGWEAKSIGGLGAPTGISAVYVLMEREVTKPSRESDFALNLGHYGISSWSSFQRAITLVAPLSK